jgi:hypothetical protein
MSGLEAERLSFAYLCFGYFAGRQFDDVFTGRVRTKLLGVCTWFNMLLNADNAAACIQPNNVDRELHVLHPETKTLFAVKYEQHALAGG